MARPPATKYQCFEHKMKFLTGTGFAAHMRSPRYHPNGNAPKVEANPETPQGHLHTALDLLDEEIGALHGHLQTLKARREHVAQALSQ